MKTIFLILALALSITLQAQNTSLLQGAWERSLDGTNKQTLVIAGDFWSFTEFDAAQKSFVGTMGGAWELNNNSISYTYEYSTFSDLLHQQLLPSTLTSVTESELTLGSVVWQRVDNGTPGSLQGAWLITGRERNGAMNTITPGVRKTMKILSGTRFQWIAYNTETRAFLGTGGGSYTTENGRYTENIEFFSRDDSRVGASLGFDFELKEGKWHHKGKSSKGNPIYEIWSKR